MTESESRVIITALPVNHDVQDPIIMRRIPYRLETKMDPAQSQEKRGALVDARTRHMYLPKDTLQTTVTN